MSKEHLYALRIQWTGNTGNGTADYRSYNRSHIISAPGKQDIPASSDPAFRGDNARYSPEELLVASLSGCHMLWFLHLCADAGIVVVAYTDTPTGIMVETTDGGGKFKEVMLNPVVTVHDQDSLDKLGDLHAKAFRKCFIANSVNFEVKHNPTGRTI
jgi:organic hydroperoxide reductase OsmC/OhrA